MARTRIQIGLKIIGAALACALFAAPATAQSRLPVSGFADIAEQLTPAVVNIATRQRVDGANELPRFPPGSPLERFNEGLSEGAAQVTSLGSGFIISADGHVVTNNHVIEAADVIEVIMQNGDRHAATVVGRDPATDIALLKIQTNTPLPYVRLGDSDTARVGDIVLAIGNPFGLGGSLSVGVVSARNRNIDAGRYDDFIQTDAAINRGNSGGPLFNVAGEVIGVNTAIVSPTGGSVGVGFATPSSIVRPVVDQLLRYGETRRGWLGVRLANVTAEFAERAGLQSRSGAVITRITPGGPAAAAGLRSGDVVLRFGEREVADSRALTRMIGETQVGENVPLDIVRNGRTTRIVANIERLDEPDSPSRVAHGDDRDSMRRDGGPRGGQVMGLSLSELDASLREEFQIEPEVRGLVVLSVDPSSDAAERFRAGDVIERIGATDAETIDDARVIAARALEQRRSIVLRINRDGAVTYRALRGRG